MHNVFSMRDELGLKKRFRIKHDFNAKLLMFEI